VVAFTHIHFFNTNLFHSGKDCYFSNPISTLVAVSIVCFNSTTIIKGPSSQIIFDSDSVFTICSNVSLSYIHKSSFSESKASPAVSFIFGKELPQGVVLNKKFATVGELVGDGTLLEFEYPDRISHFIACLLVGNSTVIDPAFTEMDFGYSSESNDYIIPLKWNITQELYEGNFIYWCSDVSFPDSPHENGRIQLFPIWRMKDFESQNDEYYSDQAVDLVYTLGACYCLDLLLLSFYVIFIVITVRKMRKNIPVVAWIAMIFCIVCIFRIVFCFMWPSGGFVNKPVAQYAVFEIPTFLLFSAVIIAIGFWRKLSRKRYVC
jgi:hypothetical protein